MTFSVKSGDFAGSSTLAGRMVVARFRDGRMLKGTTADFAPNRETFHLYEGGDVSTTAVQVAVDELKAVLYVKSFEGDSSHRDDYDFGKSAGHGRKAEVTFEDGEVIAGFTMGYSAERQGFFLEPADAESNNSRIYVVNKAVKSMRWV
jgi:hypothetical protein